MFTGDAGLSFRMFKETTKLALLQTVDPFQFLFFAELGAIVRQALTALPMLTGRIAPALNRAFLCHAASAFQK
jgi:hypothetical protein